MMYHIDEIRSPIPVLGEMTKSVALLGFKDNAVLATIDQDCLQEVTAKEDAPKIEFLSKLKDEDEVFKQMESTTETYKKYMCNLIVLAPYLAKILIKRKTGTTSGVFMTALKAAIARDALVIQEIETDEDDVGNNVKEITALLRRLYFWAQEAALWETMGEVVTNAANAAFDDDVTDWKVELHSRFISKQIDESRREVCNGTMENLKGTLVYLKNETENSRRAATKEVSKLNANKISSSHREIILNMSLTDGIDPAEDLVEMMKDCMEQSTAAMAYKHLHDRLQDRKVSI